jgi:hypothetical protein
VGDGLRSADSSSFVSAIASDLQPLRKRFELVMQIEDPDLMRAGLQSLLKDCPDLAKQILADPTAAKALESGMLASAKSAIGNRQSKILPLLNEFDPSQPRDDQGMWTDTAGGGMSWKTAKGHEFSLHGKTLTVKTAQGKLVETEMRPGIDVPKVYDPTFRQAGLDPKEHQYIESSPNVFYKKSEAAPFNEAASRADKFRAGEKTAAHDNLEKAVPGVHALAQQDQKVRDSFDTHHHEFNKMMGDENNDGVRPPAAPDHALAEKHKADLAANPRAALYIKAKAQADNAHWADNSGQGSAGKEAMRIPESGGSHEDALAALAKRRPLND